jgi:hypothetical protein
MGDGSLIEISLIDGIVNRRTTVFFTRKWEFSFTVSSQTPSRTKCDYTATHLNGNRFQFFCSSVTLTSHREYLNLNLI